jgi:cytochrome c5
MAAPAHAIAHGAAAIAGIILAIGLLSRPADYSARGEEAAPASKVTADNVTLHSVSINLPTGDRTFPGGARADAINNNCLACHSAGMLLTQPALSRDSWRDEVNKMRDAYKAPIAQQDVPKIVEYLVNLSAERSRASQR